MNQKMHTLPHFMQAEIEKLQKALLPLLRKNMKYRLFSFLMIGFSLFNLFFLLLKEDGEPISKIAVILYAIIGAIGFSLWKESRHNRNEIRKQSQDYMLARIQKSTHVTDYRKKVYYRKVKNHPLSSMSYFFAFLAEEEQQKQRSSFEE